MIPMRLWVLVVGALLVVVGVVLSQREPTADAVPARDSTREGAAAGPSVVLVLVDQLRKDTFEAEASRLNALASKGLVFDQMRSSAPWTYPSVISLMSGLYPQQHGAGGNEQGDMLSTFAEDLPLLPALLRSQGWSTAAFVTNPFLHTWNPFHRGFDTFDVSFINSQGNRRGHGDVVWTKDMFADTVNGKVVEHFDNTPYERSEFTYIHYIDVHGPWERAPFWSIINTLFRDRYEASVRYMDDRIVEIYEYFLRRYDSDVLFIITSDHGRALRDDEEVGLGSAWRSSKNTVHDFNLRIPFAVLPSKRLEFRGAVEEPTSHIDVVPTLMAWLDLPLDYEGPGKNLYPAIRRSVGGHAADVPPRGIYSRMSAFGFHSDAIYAAGTKVIRHFEPGTHVVKGIHGYDVERDPRELNPLESLPPGAQSALDAAASVHGLEYESHFDTVGEELKDQLKALGYLE